MNPLTLFFCLAAGNVTPQGRSVPQPPQSRSDSVQIAVLRQEVQSATEFRSDLLSTVHFALTLVGGLAILLVGYNWYVNFRLLEKGKDDLQRELKDSLEKELVAHRMLVDEKLGHELKSATQAATARLDDSLKSLSQQIAAGETAQRQESDVILQRLDRISLRVQLMDELTTAQYWELKKVPRNEIANYTEALSLAVNLNDEFEVGQALTNIIRLGQSGTYPFQAYIPGIVAILEKLPTKFSTEVSVIRDLLTKAPRV